MIELADGRLWAIPNGPATRWRCFAISTDRGDTWTKSQPLGFVADSPYLHPYREKDLIDLPAYRAYNTLNASSAAFTALRCTAATSAKLGAILSPSITCVGAYPSMVQSARMDRS